MAIQFLSRADEVSDRRRYYGSARTVLLVRFDPGNTDPFTASQIQRSDETATRSATRHLDPGFDFRTGINRRSQALSSRTVGLDFRAVITQARTSIASSLKLQPVDGLSRFFDLQPLKSVRQINSYRKADEIDLTFAWSDLPIDSRLIRAILVLHYEGTVSADEWATGDRDRYLVQPSGENLRFIGTIDEVGDTHDGEGDQMTMKGRDLTALLIDSEVPPGTEIRIDPSWTVLEVVNAILAKNESFDIIRGPFLRAAPNYTPPSFVESTYIRNAVSAKERWRVNGTGATAGITWKLPKEKTTYWDLITDVCVSVGLHPVIELDSLVIFEPRTMFRDQFSELSYPGVHQFPREGGHRWSLGDRNPIRRVVFGSNVLSAGFGRKLGRITVPAVKVLVRNPDAPEPEDRIVEVTYPSVPVADKVSAAGQNPTQTVFTVKLPGKTQDKAVLEAIAKQVYEGMGRQELGVTVPTDDLASFSDDPRFDPNMDPDLLAIQAGDPVELLVAPSAQRGSAFVAMAELSKLVTKARSRAIASTSTAVTAAHPEFTSALEALKAAGFGEAEARQFVEVLISANIPTSFRVNQATVVYDEGFTITLDLRDYVRVRADPEDPAGAVGGVVPGGVVT